MVEIDITERTNGTSIADVPKRNGLTDNFEEVFNECNGNIEGGKASLDGLWVFGSYARGTAVKGRSDLDIVYSIKNPRGDELSPKFDLYRSELTGCIAGKADEIIEGYRDWFTKVDVMVATIPRNKWVTLLRKTKESREERPTGEPRVYDLIAGRFVSREELLEKAPEEAQKVIP